MWPTSFDVQKINVWQEEKEKLYETGKKNAIKQFTPSLMSN